MDTDRQPFWSKILKGLWRFLSALDYSSFDYTLDEIDRLEFELASLRSKVNLEGKKS